MKLERDPRCGERNALMGLRGAECSPIKFFHSGGGGGGQVVTAEGTLPASDEAALAIINSKVPGKPLTLDRVYIHYLEAASDRFISDRFLYLHRSTLRNVASEASAGFAFMNSHRTGDLSTPSELPFGRAFVGRFETVNDPMGMRVQRTVLGVYMLRGQRPNGANGPSTDDMSEAISGGTVFDVSMGLYGGNRICDVCNQDFYAKDGEGNWLCPHVPGTHRRMSPEQIDAQKAKGVPEGLATYTLDDAHAGEVSAVYDGAIPGAGFRKALSLAKSGGLSDDDIAEVLEAYGNVELPDRFFGRIEAPRRRGFSGSTRLSRGAETYRPARPEPPRGIELGSPEDLEQLGRATRAAAYGEHTPKDDGDDEDLARLRRTTRELAGLSTAADRRERHDDDGDLAALGKATREAVGL